MHHIESRLYQPPDDSDIAHEFTAWLAARRETLRAAAGAGGRPRDSQADVAAPDAAGADDSPDAPRASGEPSPDNQTGRASTHAPPPP